MSYISAYNIPDTKGFKIPVKYIKEFIKDTKEKDRVNYLKTLTEDVMTVKELNEMKELESKNNSIEVKISKNIIITNANFNNYSFDHDEIVLFYQKNNDRILYSLEEDGEIIFNLKDEYFESNGSIYFETNNDFIKNEIIQMIEFFKWNAVIEDQGDEEYGIEGRDVCKRDLRKDEIYIKGKLK